jgi:hypothetical protein
MVDRPGVLDAQFSGHAPKVTVRPSRCQPNITFSLTDPCSAIGQAVPNVPEDLNTLYEEARRCTTSNCYTAAVLLSRKMLMNIAVKEGAEEGLHFIRYVEYLKDNNYIPPKGKHWVDHIRAKGNEATHEIKQMREQDAKDLLNFIEMLLRLIYDFPGRIPTPPAKT